MLPMSWPNSLLNLPPNSL
ncbi:hypothetical protein V2J09_009183 [Rumex salicifolius]